MSGFSAARDTAHGPCARSLAALCSLMLCAGGVACAPDTVTVRSHPPFSPRTIAKVVIAPFRVFEGTRGAAHTFNRTPEDAGDSVPPAPLRARVTSVSVPTSAPEAIRRMVYARLLQRSHIQVSLTDTVSYAPRGEGEETQDRHAQPMEQAEADAVLEGRIHLYREREGPTFAAIPASVGFELRLLDARDGNVLWVGEYFEEQKPLTQDVRGFFSRGGTFVTAEELARDGVVHVLQRLPLGKK